MTILKDSKMRLTRSEKLRHFDKLIITFVAVVYSIYPALGNYKAPTFIISSGILLLAVKKSAIGRKDFPLIAFLGVLAVYFGLSIHNQLTNSWTIYFDTQFVITQTAGYIGFALSYFYFKDKALKLIRLQTLSCILAIGAITTAAFVSGNVYENNPEKYGFVLANLNTMEILRQFFLSIILFRYRRISLLLISVFILLLLSVSFQHYFLIASLVAVYFARTVVKFSGVLFLITCALIPFLVAPYSYEIEALDHNTGLRAIIWSDAIDTFVSTNFIGVGLGTESVRGSYEFVHGKWIWFEDSPAAIIPVGVHNELVQSLFRFGVFGLLLIGWAFALITKFWRILPRTGTELASNITAYMTLLLIFSLTVNTAISSPNFSIGTGFLVGLISNFITSRNR